MQIPPEFDIDSDASNDHTQTPEYAKDIFDYLKKREVSQCTQLFFYFYFFVVVFLLIQNTIWLVFALTLYYFTKVFPDLRWTDSQQLWCLVIKFYQVSQRCDLYIWFTSRVSLGQNVKQKCIYFFYLFIFSSTIWLRWSCLGFRWNSSMVRLQWESDSTQNQPRIGSIFFL